MSCHISVMFTISITLTNLLTLDLGDRSLVYMDMTGSHLWLHPPDAAFGLYLTGTLYISSQPCTITLCDRRVGTCEGTLWLSGYILFVFVILLYFCYKCWHTSWQLSACTDTEKDVSWLSLTFCNIHNTEQEWPLTTYTHQCLLSTLQCR